MSKWASNLLDTLLPRRSVGGPAQRFSAELVYGFGAFELLATGAFCLTELAWGTAMLGVIYAVTWVPILIILIWLRNGGDPARASTALMVVLFSLITVTNFSTGGQALGANIALPTVVLFAVLMSSPRVAMFWTALVVIEIIVVSQLRNSTLDFPIKPNPEWTASAIDRVPLFFSLASALIALITRRALQHFQVSLEEAREEATATASRFTDFAELAADGFWETDADLRLIYVSPSFAQAIGLEIEQMIGRTPEQAYRLRFPDLPDLSAYAEPLGKQEAFSGQILQMFDHAGQKRLLLNQGLPRFNDAGVFEGYRGVVQDVTAQHNAEKALRFNEQRLRSITENIPAMISYIDSDGVFRFNNSAYEKWLRRPLADITGHHVSDLYDAETYQLIEPYIKRSLHGEQVTFDLDPSGSRKRYVRVTYVPEVNVDGKVLGIYGLIHDISELKRIEQQLRILAEYDSLTGLPNRNRFKDRLSEAISRSERNDDTLAVLFLDIDHFKSINDSLGHQAGDAVLKEFARRLTQCIRKTDKLTRLAGDEFVIVLEGMHDPGETSVVAQKIIAAMTLPLDVIGHSRVISIESDGSYPTRIRRHAGITPFMFPL